MSAAPAQPTCRNCESFRNAAGAIEAAFPGLLAMGSGRGSTRADDGLCDRHGLYLPADASCCEFASRQ